MNAPPVTGVVLAAGGSRRLGTPKRLLPYLDTTLLAAALGLGRGVFGELRRLHGDKGVWKLVESGRHPVRELAVESPIPLDVDTWDDYERLVESS